jgi:hypothetical protein
MYNNWFVEERMLQVRHDEMLKASELRRLVNNGRPESFPPLHVRTLSKLGDTLVKAGFWLQGRYGNMVEFPALEIDDPCWE